MDEGELFYEFTDRHIRHLVYEGAYRFAGVAEELQASISNIFKNWQQRIYRFDNDFGASVVLYEPVAKNRMTWDLVTTRFISDDPLAYRYADAINSNLHWRDVQRILDQIKHK